MDESGGRVTRGGLLEGVVVIRSDSTIDSVEGHAPIEWVGRHAREVFEPGSEAADAIRLLFGSERSARFVTTRHVEYALHGQTVSLMLVAVAGIPVRPVIARVDQLVLRVAEVFLTQARHARIELDVHIDRDLPPASWLDEEKVAWALSTLVGSAMRHVTWKRETDEEPLVSISVSFDPAEKAFVFRVADNGRGIPETERRWLFERNPATGKAAGLALVMVRDVMVAHRGSIRAESDHGRGSVFTMTLPQA